MNGVHKLPALFGVCELEFGFAVQVENSVWGVNQPQPIGILYVCNVADSSHRNANSGTSAPKAILSGNLSIFHLQL